MRKILSAMLIAALTVTTVITMPLYSSAAAGGGSPGDVRSVSFGSFSSISMVPYNDELFTGDPAEYDPQLAVASVTLASAACASRRSTKETYYQLMSRNAVEYLEDNGFSDVCANEDFKVMPDGTKAPAVFAHKKLVDNGKEYTLVALIPKSGAMGAEAYYITRASSGSGDRGDFAYFDGIEERTLESARDYIREYGIKGDIKVWLTGYSRGGGIAQLMAADIIDDPAASLGRSVKLSPSDVYCYCLATYRTGSCSKELKADRYRSIHHIISEDDMIVNLPWEAMSFGWYGQVHDFTDGADKAEAMRLFEISSPLKYKSYIGGTDPDSFKPMKFDMTALLKGNLSMVQDDDSYLPDEQDEYINSVIEPVISLFGEEGGDVRDGYYESYQEAMDHFMVYVNSYGIPNTSTLSGSKTAVPFLLSEYISCISDKSAKNKTVKSAELNAAVEDAFNALAYYIEDENGNIRSDLEKLKDAETVYRNLRGLCFSENEEVVIGGNGIPKKYSLKRKLRYDATSAKLFRKLSAKLYSMTMNDVLAAQNADSATVSRITSEKDSAAMSRVFAHLLFDNSRQSSSIGLLSSENEQFKQLATLISNYKSFSTMHDVDVVLPWMQTRCSLYDDYRGLPSDQYTGYRRVFINRNGAADISGSVRDESGNAAASFRNGRMLSKNDDWVGYTVSDDGGWLRLPLGKSYTVELKVSEDTSLGLKLSEYSVYEGKAVRSANWEDLQAYKNGSVILSVPAAAAGEMGYVLPSNIKYDVSVSGSRSPDVPADKTVYSKSVPKVKNVRVRSSSKSMTVSWKKLNVLQRRKFSKVEVQYSTSKKFKKYKTIDVSKNRKSVRIRGLKKGRTYYVRVRNIKKKDGVRYVSGWSAKKKTRIR